MEAKKAAAWSDLIVFLRETTRLKKQKPKQNEVQATAPLVSSEALQVGFHAKVGTRLVPGVQAPVCASPVCSPTRAHCSSSTDTPACFSGRLVPLHLDLAREQEVTILVTSSWLRSQLGALGIQVTQSNLRGRPGARLSLSLWSGPSRQLR